MADLPINSFDLYRYFITVSGFQRGMDMKIGFSTFVMQGGKSGVAAYIRDLMKYLQLEDQQNDYDLLMTRDEADLIPLTNSRFSKTLFAPRLNHPLLNIAWHNTLLPLSGREATYDILHIPSYRRIPLIKTTKLVATVHDLATFSLDAKYDRARMFFNRKIVPAMIRNVDHVITVSHYTKQDIVRLIGYPEEKISVIYSGINKTIFKPTAKDEARAQLAERHDLQKPFFVYLSRLEHPAKNHIRLIEAFERFKLNNDSAHQLVFAGADWNGAEIIRARAASSPVHTDIRFLGFAPLDSLPLLYSGCDLMVYPSLFEGFGFPLVEALACGAPVICSNTSSMKEIAGERIPTFDPYRTEAICEAMEAALASGWSDARRQQGLDYAATFDWHESARQVINVYNQLHG
jgi:glycosyltransferase involved in cell wall biosynthesis